MYGINEGYGSVVYPVPMQIAVDSLNIHKAPHLDEIATAVILGLFGEAFFPGVRQALAKGKITFMDHPTWTRADYIKNRTLPIGIGLGTWFNEHTRENERMEGWCAFTLCTRYLRIDHLPALQRLQKEVLWCDTQAECSSTMIAELIKVDMRRQEDYVNQSTGKTIKVGERTAIFEWAKLVLEAIIKREIQISLNQAMQPGPDEKTLADYYLGWWAEFEAEQEKPVDPRVKEALEKAVRLSMCNKDTTVTELAYAVEAMSRTGAEADIIKDTLQFTFTAMYLGQVEFFAEVDRQEARPSIEYVRARLDRTDRFVMLSTVESGSRYALKASRHLRNKLQKDIPWHDRLDGITLLRSPNGNTQVFADKEIKDCWVQIRMSNGRIQSGQGIFEVLVRMIRTHELRYMGYTRFSFDILGTRGEGLDGLWYYFYNGGCLLNGTNTKDKPPTKIPLDEVKEAIKHCLHPDLASEWIARHIPFSNN